MCSAHWTLLASEIKKRDSLWYQEEWLSLTCTSSTIPEKNKVTHGEIYPKARAHSSQSLSAWVSVQHKSVRALTFILPFSMCRATYWILWVPFHVIISMVWFKLTISLFASYFSHLFSILSSFYAFLGLFLCVYFIFFISLSAIALCYFRHCLRILVEKEMASHSSVLAWRIPGTGEPGGLPSMGSHRVGHDWSDLAAAAVRILAHYILIYYYLYMVILFQWVISSHEVAKLLEFQL